MENDESCQTPRINNIQVNSDLKIAAIAKDTGFELIYYQESKGISVDSKQAPFLNLPN